MQVKNAGKPVMLFKTALNSIHRGFIPYEGIVDAAMGQALSDMGRRLYDELAKQ